MSRKNRRVANYYLLPSIQLRLAVFVMAVSMIGIGIVVASGFYKLSSLHSGFRCVDDLVQLEFVNFVFYVFIGLFLAIGILAFLGGIVITHEVAGPLFAMNRHLDRVLAGELQSRIHLRKNAELQEIAEKLNQLTEKLEHASKKS